MFAKLAKMFIALALAHFIAHAQRPLPHIMGTCPTSGAEYAAFVANKNTCVFIGFSVPPVKVCNWSVEWELEGSSNIENPRGTSTFACYKNNATGELDCYGAQATRKVIDPKKDVQLGAFKILRVKRLPDIK